MASIFDMKFHSITAERGHRNDPPADADVMFTINKGGKYKFQILKEYERAKRLVLVVQ